ncbi:hypothetical protein THARTR1_03944 [Trichoderma harzianum]|uniref:Uncharacterized protein n=1 Tax=Trichoderma harzianum TaxID=5544 RepID=A0A2K0UE26_TRIHA|nr:hypothetical protein THARTR1_03944 [Trichoderma harzianum]
MQPTAGDDGIVGEQEDAGLASPEAAIQAGFSVERGDELVSQSQTGNLVAEETQINAINSGHLSEEMGSLIDETGATPADLTITPIALRDEIIIRRRQLHGSVQAMLASREAFLALKNDMHALEDAIRISEDSINYYERNGLPLGNSVHLHSLQLQQSRNLTRSLRDQMKDHSTTQTLLIGQIEEVTEFIRSVRDKYEVREIRETTDELVSLWTEVLALPNVIKTPEEV